MHLQFVAVFPGAFLNCLDACHIVQNFSVDKNEIYKIQLTNGETWKRQHFVFEFTSEFEKQAFEGFAKKGPEVEKNARSIQEIFKLTFEGILYSSGMLKFDFDIPDLWDANKQELATAELDFQLYHVSKNFFLSIQGYEGLRLNEFKKWYTYLGADGVEGLL